MIYFSIKKHNLKRIKGLSHLVVLPPTSEKKGVVFISKQLINIFESGRGEAVIPDNFTFKLFLEREEVGVLTAEELKGIFNSESESYEIIKEPKQLNMPKQGILEELKNEKTD